jgi:putative hydrolase of the HAD superfamily
VTIAAPTRDLSKLSGRPIAAVLVDVDDTLVDHSGSARAAVRAISGYDEWALWQAITEDYARRVTHGVLRYEGMHLARTVEFFAALGVSLPEGEVRRREAQRVRLLRCGERVFDDALGFLEYLSAAGLRAAAVTNATGAHQRAKLRALGLTPYLDAVVVAGEVGARKPEPELFHTACARLGVPPGQAAHIGDRLAVDAIGAWAAGLAGMWLDRGHRRGDGRGAGVPAVGSLAECPALLAGDAVAAAC